MAFTLKRKSTSAKNDKIKPGKYEAVVTNIEEIEGYVKGHAYRIHYSVFVNEIEKPFSEVFHNAPDNDRTQNFRAYLDSIGIGDDIGEYVGVREMLTFAKEVNDRGAVFTNIVDREVIA